MILTIARRELRSLFLSPLAWTLLAVVQGLMAFLFLARVELFHMYQPQLAAQENGPGLTEIIVPDLFASGATILLLITPMLTMRLIAEERRNKTLPLLFSAPVSMTDIVLGKYLGALFFLLIVLGLIALMPLSLALGAGLDYGILFSATLGLFFVLGSFTAVGLFMSTLTQHPTVAAVGGFGMLLLFWVLDWSASGTGVLAALSLFNHYKPFLEGVFDTADALYHVLLITTFLVLSIRRLDADRLGG